MAKTKKSPKYEKVERTTAGHMEILEERRWDASRADAWLGLAMFEAREAGLTLRQIADATGYSHEKVRTMTTIEPWEDDGLS